MFVHRPTARKIRVSTTIVLLVILAVQLPTMFMMHSQASASLSSPLDDNQPPPKVSPAPAPSNDTGTIAAGSVSTVVICVEFSNLDHTKSISEINKLVFDDMNRYYQEVSFGAISIVGKTVGWYRMNYTLSYYGRDGLVVDDPNFDGGIDSWWLLRDAVKAADKDVDFAAYDHVLVVHSGNGEESSKVPDDIWSVAYSGLWIKTYDALSVRDGVIVPETEARGAIPFGVFTHEFGHLLGLPDLYAYGSSKSYVEHWSLMDRGLWNGDPRGSTPADPMAYCKILLGWIPPSRVMVVEASMNANVTLQPIELKTDGYQAIKIPVKDMEYYLVEVRQRIGYDAYLPSNGVLVSYVNERLGSGYGRVRLIDSHTLTETLDDAAFDVGRVFTEPNSKFSVSILSTDGKAYLINVDRSGPAPDITIKDIRFEPSAARTNETITISVDVANEGTNQAANFYVNCYIDNVLYTRTRLTLSAGRSTTISVQWKATGGSHDVRFAVDSASLVIESNKNNNSLSKSFAIGLLLKLLVPKDVQAIVNGTQYRPDKNNEITVGILPGTQKIEVDKIQPLGNGTRRVFVKWGDGDTSNPRTMTIQSDLSLSAEYKKQYYVSVEATTGSVSGEGWYDEGSTAIVVANSPCNEVQQKSRTVFTHWSGDSTSNVMSISVTVDNPRSFTANWKYQYYLSVNSNYGSTVGSGWYDANSLATFSIQPMSEIGNDTRKYFTGWTGDATSSQASGTITMDASKSISATWRIEYLLTVLSPYGDPTGQGWYDSGTVAEISVRSVVDLRNGTRRVFTDWNGDISAASPAASTTMDKPKVTIAEWKTQCQLTFKVSGLPDRTPVNLTINSNLINGTTPFTYSDWYDSQTTLELNATKKIKSGFRAYIFGFWVNSTGAKISDTFTVNGPGTLTAVYNQSLGCIIATATFESELSPEVQFLRSLRDQKIMATFAGSQFMTVFNAWYYSFSPFVADAIANNQVLRGVAKLTLYPLIGILHLSVLTFNALEYAPEFAVVMAGFTASYMMGALYFAPILVLVLRFTRKRVGYPQKVRTLLCMLLGTIIGIGVSDVLKLELPMMLASALFVLTTMSLSAILTTHLMVSASRKLNWNVLRSLHVWFK